MGTPVSRRFGPGTAGPGSGSESLSVLMIRHHLGSCRWITHYDCAADSDSDPDVSILEAGRESQRG